MTEDLNLARKTPPTGGRASDARKFFG